MEKFNDVIENAKIACKNSNCIVDDHFPQVGKMITLAKGASRKISDYKLSCYACYLIVQNTDPRKEVVELGANIFRITQTESLLEYQEKPDELIATNTHYRVGKAIRKTIKELGGIMPENLENLKESIKELKESKK